eukprot:Transcript_6564.p1 GENE.Transcript_6564~~Transcript_6564.p1  ORF type:complete len:669 (-),score=322.57 Transcript_6564:230-2236(-)
MATIIVKITDGKDIRRFTASTDTISYDKIHKHAADGFNLGSKSFKLKYKDDEGDQITMSTDSELAEAVAFAKSLEPPVLRLTLEAGSAVNGAACTPDGANTNAETPPDLAALFNNIKEQLPQLVEQLPDAVKAMLPNMEVDLSASAEATAQAAAAQAGAYGYAHPAADPNMEGIHPRVECDKTGMCPIIGTRYHLKGHDWDLCAAEFAKLPDAEKAGFEAIEPPCYRPKAKPNAAPPDNPKGFHPGVTCDKTGQNPIFGWRFHLKGQNYDLCEAEFNKLPDAEKANYEKIAPPWPCWGGRGGFGRGCGKGFGSGWGHHGGRGWAGEMGGWGGKGGGWGGKGGGGGWGEAGAEGAEGGKGCGKGFGKPHKLLAARFVCDVSIFDGTQMAPATKFTKIWRLKNTGEVPWPPGTQIMYVGGDQMSGALTVPLSRQGPVAPGEEVDVAVDLVAPQEHGRYVGYWRLTGPMGRKKWGQRVWAHIHVVDPHAEPQPPTEKEILEMQAAASDRENDEEGDDDGADEDGAAPAAAPESDAASDTDMVIVTAPEAETATDKTNPTTEAIVTAMSAATVSEAAAPAAAPGPSKSAAVEVAETLGAMGFVDAEIVQYVVEKNGPDLDACVRDLTTLNENEQGLRDLAEMGFPDTKLNAKLLIKNGGSVKNCVRDLVADM